jgi:imidazolonepropionase-like amidohydrolase
VKPRSSRALRARLASTLATSLAMTLPATLATTLSASLAFAQPAKPKPAARPAPTAPTAPKREVRDDAEAVLAFTGATVHVGNGEVIGDATVIVAAGKIRAVGKGLAAPAGALTLPARGLVITPGLTDALTALGLVEVDLEEPTHDDREKGGSDRLHAGFRAAEGYNPASVLLGVSRAEGLCSAGVIPSGGLISGQSAWVDLAGSTASEALVQAPLALHVRLDAGAGGTGFGHANALLRVREAFDDAKSFAKNRASWERNQSRPFAPSRLDLEAMVPALERKLPVVFHVDRAADILAALALAKQLDLRPILAGGAEAWKVAPALAEAKVPVFVHPLQQPSSFDTLGAREDNAALLHRAGVIVGLSTFDTHNARKLRQVAGNAVRAGLPHEAALAAITRVPAEVFGLGARYGTLGAGKVANLVVWSGDPLELSTRVVSLVIRGRAISLENRQSALLEKYRRLPPR